MNLRPFRPFLTKRPYENNPLTKQLSTWQGPEEIRHLEYGSPEWNMALFEYLLAHKGSKNMHNLLGAEVKFRQSLMHTYLLTYAPRYFFRGCADS